MDVTSDLHQFLNSILKISWRVMHANKLKYDISSKFLQHVIVVLLVDDCACSSNQSTDLNFFSALVRVRVE